MNDPINPLFHCLWHRQIDSAVYRFSAFYSIGHKAMHTVAFVIFAGYLIPSRYTAGSRIFAGVVALFSLPRPMFTGINLDGGDWTWILLLNAPADIVVFILFFCDPRLLSLRARRCRYTS